jgi:putative transposase
VKTNRAIKVRIYPTAEQRGLFARTFGCCRKVWNLMLADKNAHFEQTGQSLQTTPAQYKDAYPYLREVDSFALCNIQLNLQSAYANFFRDKSVGFPQYKSLRRNPVNSYTTNNVRIEGTRIRLPKCGLVKARMHRTPKDWWTLKSATVSRSSEGKYYCALLFEFDQEPEPVIPRTACGLDYSSSELFVGHLGETPAYPKPYRNAQRRLAKMQRRRDKMQKGSNNRRKYGVRIAKQHRKVANQRKDFLHNLSAGIANRYDVVCIEDLNMRGIAQGLKFGKSTHDNGWGMFTNMLSYKLADRGKYLVKVDRFYPSSKTCSVCGSMKETLELGERTYSCERCGLVIDRDMNAARNILHEGLLSFLKNTNRCNDGDSLLTILGLPESWQEASSS